MVSVSSLNFPRLFWLSVACFSGLLDRCVHWEMLVGVGYLGNGRPGGDSLRGSIGSLNKRTGKLPMVFCHKARGNPEKLV